MVHCVHENLCENCSSPQGDWPWPKAPCWTASRWRGLPSASTTVNINGYHWLHLFILHTSMKMGVIFQQHQSLGVLILLHTSISTTKCFPVRFQLHQGLVMSFIMLTYWTWTLFVFFSVASYLGDVHCAITGNQPKETLSFQQHLDFVMFKS